MKNNALKGGILVALGAASYGMLASFVKMAYHEGFSTAEVTLSQFSIGFAGLFVLTLFRKRESAPETKAVPRLDTLILITRGKPDTRLVVRYCSVLAMRSNC